MAVSFNAGGGSYGTSGGHLDYLCSFGSGSDQCSIVGVIWYNHADGVVDDVSVGGYLCSRFLHHLDGAGVGWDLWGLPTGTLLSGLTPTIHVTMSAGVAVINSTITNFDGVLQTEDGSANGQTDQSGVSSVSVTFSSNPSDSALVCIGGGEANLGIAGTNATRTPGTSSSGNPFMGYYLGPSSTDSIGVAIASGTDTIIELACRIRASGGGGGGGNPWYAYAQQRQPRRMGHDWQRRGGLWVPRRRIFDLKGRTAA